MPRAHNRPTPSAALSNLRSRKPNKTQESDERSDTPTPHLAPQGPTLRMTVWTVELAASLDLRIIHSHFTVLRVDMRTRLAYR